MKALLIPMVLCCLFASVAAVRAEDIAAALTNAPAAGKPVVIEETFPLKCPPADLREFLRRSRGRAAGWIGFYWGKTLEEYRRSEGLSSAITAGWLEFFARKVDTIR